MMEALVTTLFMRLRIPWLRGLSIPISSALMMSLRFISVRPVLLCGSATARG